MLILLSWRSWPSLADGKFSRGLRAASGMLWAIAWVGLFACGSDSSENATLDGNADSANEVAAVIKYKLTAEQDKLALERGESGTLSVHVKDLEGNAVKGVSVSFALSGQALDSGLDSLSATSNGDGIAMNAVLAGARECSFEVRVSAVGAESISVPVTVFPEGFGAIEVTATYSGRYDPSLRTVSLFAGKDCDSLEGEKPTATNSSSGGSHAISSFFLAAGKVYAVLVEVLGGDDTALASGCVDGLKVTANEVTKAEVPYVDASLTVEGQFDVTVLLDGSQIGAKVAEMVDKALKDRIAAAAILGSSDTAEAEFLLTALSRALGSDALLLLEGTALNLELPSGNLLSTLQDRLDGTDHGPLVGAKALADVARTSLDQLTLEAGLSLSQRVTSPSVIWHSRTITGPSINDSLAAPSYTYVEWPQHVADVNYDSAHDTLGLGGIQVYLPLMDLADQAIHQAAAVGVNDEPLVEPLLGCDTMMEVWRAWAIDQFGGSQCDAKCAQAACDRVVANMLTAADAALGLDSASQDESPNSDLDIDFQLLSMCDTQSDCVSLQVTDLQSTSVSDSWTSNNVSLKTVLEGTATGTRN